MTSKTAAVCALCLGVGLGVGWFAHRQPEAPIKSRAEAPAAAAKPAEASALNAQLGAGMERSLDMALMRGVVREEVRAALADGTLQAPQVNAAHAQKAANAETELADAEEAMAGAAPTAAYTQAKAQVAEGIRRGVWTERERRELSSALGEMSPAERTVVVHEVIRATNQGKLRIDFEGPLFL
ncbi:MAG: hypothetical protein ACOY0T_16010 [Myxococcota bacterium]